MTEGAAALTKCGLWDVDIHGYPWRRHMYTTGNSFGGYAPIMVGGIKCDGCGIVQLATEFGKNSGNRNFGRQLKCKRCMARGRPPRPRVARRTAKGIRRASDRLRAHIWSRDPHECYLCREPVSSADWHLEHILAISRGGSAHPHNLAIACAPCNAAKGTKSLEATLEMFPGVAKKRLRTAAVAHGIKFKAKGITTHG